MSKKIKTNSILNPNWSIEYAIVLLIYVISHGLMLLVYGAWWDDMLLWNVSSESLAEFLGPSNINNPVLLFIIKTISGINDMKLMTLVFRMVPFLCWLVSVTSFFFILKKITNNHSFTFYASLLAASSGLNKCLILISCFHYSISIALFMLGLIFFTYDYYKDNIECKISTALLWLLSLLVWRTAVLVIPILLLIVCIKKTDFNWKSKGSYQEIVRYGLKNYWIHLVSLVIFALLYLTLLAPGGKYQSYYHIDLFHFLSSPITSVTASVSILLQYIVETMGMVAYPGARFALSTVIFLFFLILLYKYQTESVESKKLFVIACLVLLFSIYPQTLINAYFQLTFRMSHVTSRVASLAIFPIAIIITYLIQFLPYNAGKYIFIILLSGSILVSLYTNLDYEKQWARNEALTNFLQSHQELDGKNLIFVNNVTELSAFKSFGDSFYEYEGCARYAYGVNTKTKCKSIYADYPEPFSPDYYIVMLKDQELPYFTLMKDRLFNHEKYQKTINELIVFLIYNQNPKEITGQQ